MVQEIEITQLKLSRIEQVILMLVEEIKTDTVYELSPHNHAYINPYIGCTMGCPFCYWLKQEDWEGKIKVKTNIEELLEEKLKDWPQNEFLYLGSVCDPFNELEEKYHLSEKCLKVIDKYDIPVLITTSAATDVVIEYSDLLKSLKKLIVVVELSRIPFVENLNQGGVHRGINCANALREKGIEVWTTLAPVLPEITKLDQILEQLNKDIPVYIDKLDCNADDILGKRTLKWIYEEYPNLADEYEKIIKEHDFSYFYEIEKKYVENKRVKKFPFQLTH